MQEISVKSVRGDVEDQISEASSTLTEWDKYSIKSNINRDKYNAVKAILDGFFNPKSPTSLIGDTKENITGKEITVVRTALEICSFLLTQMVEDP